MIKCETTIGKEEIDVIAEISLKYASKRKRIFGAVFLLAAAGLFLYAGILGFLANGLTFNVFIRFLGSVFFLVWVFFIKRYQKARIVTKIKGMKRAFLRKIPKEHEDINKREYVFSKDCIEIKTAFEESRLNWDFFISYADIKHYIYLTGANDALLLVDKSTMSDDEIKELYNLLEEKILSKELK